MGLFTIDVPETVKVGLVFMLSEKTAVMESTSLLTKILSTSESDNITTGATVSLACKEVAIKLVLIDLISLENSVPLIA